MAPALAGTLQGFLPVTPSTSIDARNKIGGPAGGPIAEASRLLARSSKNQGDPSRGVLDPNDINNVGFFVLFALIGVAFVATGIWFFFWAKNGGFVFKEEDWDDYKSTVLRRKGPNGTVLSGATKSTDLGGGSIYKDFDDDGRTTITESTALSGITAGASDIFAREKRRKKQDERRKRKGKSKSQRHVGNDGVTDEMAEKEAQNHLRDYRHERPARVGGLNKQSDGSAWDGSTNASESVAASSDLMSNRQSTPTNTPTKKEANGRIRKVYSTADRNADRESERNRAEARRLREEGRAARRDFSYQRAGNISESALSQSLLSSGAGDSTVGDSTVGGSTVGGSTLSGSTSELGTKSYHHPMPELREQRRRDREERRARRGGYRRGNDEESEL